MGSSDLRAAFDAVVRPAGYSVSVALLAIVRDAAQKEWQVLTFRGNRPDGSPFEVVSERHSPNADPNVVARETASKFLNPEPSP